MTAALLGYWLGSAGDPDLARVERWLLELECGEVHHFTGTDD